MQPSVRSTPASSRTPRHPAHRLRGKAPSLHQLPRAYRGGPGVLVPHDAGILASLGVGVLAARAQRPLTAPVAP